MLIKLGTLSFALILLIFEFPHNACRDYFAEKPPGYSISIKDELLTSNLGETIGSIRLEPIAFKVPNSNYPDLELRANTAYELVKGKPIFILDDVQIDFISLTNMKRFPTDVGMQLVYDNQTIELPNVSDSSKPRIISTITDGEMGRRASKDENPMIIIVLPVKILKEVLQARDVKLQSSFLTFQLSEQQLMGLRAFAGSIVLEDKDK